MRKELGKIKKADFGIGGYQDAMVGISFELGGESWGVNDFWGEWKGKRSGREQWSEDDRIQGLGKTAMRIAQLLTDSKKENVSCLKDVPIEAEFDGNILKSWRVLKEVI